MKEDNSDDNSHETEDENADDACNEIEDVDDIQSVEGEIIDSDEALEKIEKIEDPQEKIKALKALVIRSYKYSGPIPDPSHFQGYENVLPGAANRILTMAEKQQDNSIQCDNKKYELREKSINFAKDDNNNSYNLANRILFSGILLIFAILILSVYLLMNGKEVAGYISLISGILTAFFGPIKSFFNTKNTFLGGDSSNDKDLEESQEKGVN